MHQDFFLALGNADGRHTHPTRIAGRNRCRQLAFAAVNQEQTRRAPALDMALTEAAKDNVVHIASVVVFFADFKLAVLGPVTDAVAKHHHTRHHLAAAHVADIVAFDTGWFAGEPQQRGQVRQGPVLANSQKFLITKHHPAL